MLSLAEQLEMPLPHPSETRPIAMKPGYRAAWIAGVVKLGMPVEVIEPPADAVLHLATLVSEAHRVIVEDIPYSKHAGFFPFTGTPSVEKTVNATKQIYGFYRKRTGEDTVIPLDVASYDCFLSYVTMDRSTRLEEALATRRFARLRSQMQRKATYDWGD